tara:strand:- start:91 stop:555 length:465 start_codon:yes stop_codon:yes gene_type:complete
MNNFVGEKLNVDWDRKVTRVKALLQDESELQEIVRLVGVESLSERDRLKLVIARMIREDFLQQNAFDDIDTYTSREKQYEMIETILDFEDKGIRAMDLGAYYDEIIDGTDNVRERIGRMKFIHEDDIERFAEIRKETEDTIQKVIEKGGVESDA